LENGNAVYKKVDGLGACVRYAPVCCSPSLRNVRSSVNSGRRSFLFALGRASFEDVRCYQLHLAARGVGVPTPQSDRCDAAVLFPDHPQAPRDRGAYDAHPRAAQAPDGAQSEEVARLLNAAPGLKYKAALSVAYGAGLRGAEVVSRKVCDIDSRRMIIRVEQGKGRKVP
jgi:integrase/recombinase XerD